MESEYMVELQKQIGELFDKEVVTQGKTICKVDEFPEDWDIHRFLTVRQDFDSMGVPRDTAADVLAWCVKQIPVLVNELPLAATIKPPRLHTLNTMASIGVWLELLTVSK